MQKMVKVDCRNGLVKEYPENTTLLEVAESFKNDFNYPIIVAKVNNIMEELSYALTRRCEVRFYDRSSVYGHTVYSHGVHFLLIVAVKKVLGNEAEVIIQHSIDKGVYCEIINKEINKEIIKQIENKMFEIVKQDYNFVKLSVSRKDAMQFFRKKKQFDKVDVFKYISNTYINLYRLDEYYDYFFSEMPYSTKVLDDFKLTYIKVMVLY